MEDPCDQTNWSKSRLKSDSCRVKQPRCVWYPFKAEDLLTGSINLTWLCVRCLGGSRRTPRSPGTHSGGSSCLRLHRGNGETKGSPPEGWPVFAACLFVLHQMFTQNTAVPLRTRSAPPSNLPHRQRHRVPAGQHLSQSAAVATQPKPLSAALSRSAAPVSCQTLCTLRPMGAPARSVSVRPQLALCQKHGKTVTTGV